MEEMVVGGRVEVAVEVMGGMMRWHRRWGSAMEEEVAVGVAGVPGQAGMASHGIGSSPNLKDWGEG